MKIYVCVKHVPDTAATITVIGETGFEDSIKFVMNPYDEYALEEAVRIVEQEGGEVVALTVGRESAVTTLRAALAMGADRGIHVITETFFLDSLLTSQVLKKVIETDGSPDLIFTGKQSVDSEGMQTHYRLAAAMDLPIANEVSVLSVADGKATAEREKGNGERDVIEMTLPCVIGAEKGLNEPRYPKMMDVMKAKKKEVKQIRLSELGLETSTASSELLKLEPAPERGRARMLEGDVKGAMEQLVDLLEKQDKVL